MEYLIFNAQCLLCESRIDDIRVPSGLMGGGEKACKGCGHKVGYRYSPTEETLFVRMVTLPADSPEPKEVTQTSYAKSFTIMADSLEKAKQLAQERIPEGYTVLVERVISTGQVHTIREHSKTDKVAMEKALAQVPGGYQIIEKRISRLSDTIVRSVYAPNEKEAVKQAIGNEEFASVQGCEIKEIGQKKLLGLVKKPNYYEFKITLEAIVEVDFKKEAEIYIRAGKKVFPPENMSCAEDLPEQLWSLTVKGYIVKGIEFALRSFAFALLRVTKKEFDELSNDQQKENLSYFGDRLYLYGLSQLTWYVSGMNLSFTEFAPLCQTLINLYYEVFIQKIENISKGNNHQSEFKVWKFIKQEDFQNLSKDKIKIVMDGIKASMLPFDTLLEEKKVMILNFDQFIQIFRQSKT